MPLSIPPGYANIAITIQNTVAGASAKSSTAIGCDVIGLPLLQADVNRIANLMRDGLRPRYDGQWSFGPVKMVWNDAGVMHVAEDVTLEAGSHASTSYAPPAISLVVSKNTGLLGKAHRGRMYMPGVDETTIDEAGVVSGVEVTAWQTSMDALMTALVGDPSIGGLVLFHDTSSPFAGSPDVLSGFTVKNIVGTMRPRQRRL